ncbi:ZIP family metal transporter [Shewanella avicenniae]|uniref:ZIP family metal transporter n=1 Tax=Shewanella avicenniae TaxID=2814294 RepID=A0ABX7QU72_9GAMM|nr:ZIP family metal transporter [Shewanella avicenniae]QSX35043.1 ZIP family metal transporter [Shewanella avicenniae]
MQLDVSQNNPWWSVLRGHARAHPLMASGLLASLLFIGIMLLQSVILLESPAQQQYVQYALLGGLACFIGTSVGAIPALLLKSIPQKLEDSMLGFAAGMMLAASAFSLLLPGIEAGTDITHSKVLGGALVIFGMAIGVALMMGLDHFTPHEHMQTGPCGPGNERCGRAWLFVFAIALHNLPEGMAVGVGFAQGDVSIGLPLSTAIALQDIPEGLAVALTLRAVGFSPLFSVLVAVGTGLLEPLGALLGVGLAGGFMLAYPIGLGLAGGAMLFVVSHEVIPETHRNGHQMLATQGLMVGFALMMLLDTLLG